jgi:N-methylhydantoinase A/oxoprolinase/acetone carboxylase beta subunit
MAAKHSQYAIGVDTGGTYTDAVILDRSSHKPLASAKALTTKGDLSVGVSEAITAALAAAGNAIRGADIGFVSVSTTLATNAVVEGHGSAVAAVLIGFDSSMADRAQLTKSFPGMPVLHVTGGHDHAGDAAAQLDKKALAKAVTQCGPSVTAFAVASAFAVRNPAHEHEARSLITELTGKPVTISTELSSALDAPRRALTAVLNARLISRISQLIEAVRKAMSALGISCSLMIVKGDGSLAVADSAAMRPIETVLSGPAASLVGARWLCGRDDFVMSDIGGTTTDVGVLQAGRPRIAEQGAEIAGWRTMVRAVDVRTVGLGGDSEIGLGVNGALSVGPQRVAPVSLLASRYPEVLSVLEADLADTEGGSQHGRFLVLPFGGGKSAEVHGLSARESELLGLVSDRPQALRKLAVSSGAQRAVASLRRRGLVQLAAFTPSDAAHVLRLQGNWNREGAFLAAKLLLRHRIMRMPDDAETEAFCREIWSETVARSAMVILETCLGGKPDPVLAQAVCQGKPAVGLAKVSITPAVPVVAVGGPAQVFYPAVGERLGCETVFPDHCDVANAVGAASGVVAQTTIVSVEGDGSGLFRIHGPGGVTTAVSALGALDSAESQARSAALAAVLELGAADAEVSIRIDKDHLPGAMNDDGLLKAAVIAEAVGRPRLA